MAHLIHPRRSNNYRPKLLQVEGVLAICVLTIGFGITFWSAAQNPKFFGDILGYSSDINVSDVVGLTNQERAKSGLSQLTLNSKLSEAANNKARDMFAEQYWAHTSPSGTEPWDFISGAGYSYRVAGENLARDFATTAQMVAAWMASPTHRDNIMHPRYQEIGVAVVNGTLDGIETTLVVQMFGTPRIEQVAQVPTTVQPVRAEAPSEQTAVFQPVPTANPDIRVKPTDTTVVVNAADAADAVGAAEVIDRAQNPQLINPTPATIDRQPTELAQAESFEFRSNPDPSIISQILVPVGTIEPHLLYSPLAITKAFGLSLIFIMVFVLVYDLYVTNNQQTVRLVGKNFAHIIYLLVVAFLIAYFKGGVVQ